MLFFFLRRKKKTFRYFFMLSFFRTDLFLFLFYFFSVQIAETDVRTETLWKAYDYVASKECRTVGGQRNKQNKIEKKIKNKNEKEKIFICFFFSLFKLKRDIKHFICINFYIFFVLFWNIFATHNLSVRLSLFHWIVYCWDYCGF